MCSVDCALAHSLRYETQYGVVLVPGLMVANAILACVLVYSGFIEAVPSQSDYFRDGVCGGEGRWVDFAELRFGSLGTGKIGAFALIIPGVLTLVQVL